VLVGVLDTIDPSVEEASINQGASPWQTFRKVTLPLSFSGIASALLLCFIESLADFATPLILSGNFRVLSVEAYIKIVGAERDMAGGAALAICLLIPAVSAFLLQRFWLERKAFATVTGKPSTARIRAIGRTTRALLVGTAGGLAITICLFYGMVLYGAFTKVWGAQYGLTIDHFLVTFREGWDYMLNSLVVAVIATPITGLLAMLMAYLIVRKRFWGRTLMDVTAMLNFAIPGTVVGIGYVLAFNDRPIMLQGTLAILIILNLFRNLPVGLRAGVATLKQIDRGIEEAAHNLGAGSFGVFRSVTLPLIAPAFFSGLAFSFMKCMTAISAVIFVVSGRWNLIPIAILGYVENGELSKAAALSVVLIVIVAAVLAVLQRFVRGRAREFVDVGN
ncbi:MAG: iron ABC transporter permease, partial [Deltaproteobacteria bacterium]|nr:iron ABC transporter permease [Deltaproteobacteria bacterium]